MKSVIHLYNSALGRLGGEQLPLNRYPLESDTVGQLCANLFPHVLDLTLAAHPWSFALRRAELALLAGASIRPDYAYAYALPSDLISPLNLIRQGAEGFESRVGDLQLNERSGPAYELEGELLYCHLPQAILRYVARISEARLWPPEFAEALSWLLASELASARINDSSKQSWCRNNYAQALSLAVAADKRRANKLRPVSAWQAARQGWGLANLRGA